MVAAPRGGEALGDRLEVFGSSLVERLGTLDDDGDDGVAVRRLGGTLQSLAGVGPGGEHSRFRPGGGIPR